MVSKFWDMMMHLTSKKKVHGHENMKLHMSIGKPVFLSRTKVKSKEETHALMFFFNIS